MPRRKLPDVFLPELELAAAPPAYRLALVREPDADPYLTGPSMSSPETVASWLALKVWNEPAELLGFIALDARLRPILHSILYRGTVSRTACEPAGILRAALLCNASSVVVFHNHPSGDPTPSADDLAFTRRLAEAGEVVGVRLVDHLILAGPGRYVSLRERGAW